MERKIYNWKQVVSYGLIALHNLLNSANEVNIKKGEYVKSQYISKYAYAMYTSGSTGKPKGNLIKI